MAMTMLTEKSDLINLEAVEEDFVYEEERTWRERHRSISLSVAEIFNY